MTSTVAPHTTLARAASGYRATLVSHALRFSCKVIGVVVLARIVSPTDHGLFAMAASVTFLLALFRDLGTSTAAIQAAHLTPPEMTALLRLHVGLGAALAAVTLLIAPLAAAFFQQPGLAALVATMSASFVLTGLSSWPRTLLNRELRFVELNRLETAGAVVGTAVMVAAGLAGAGAYAFVAFLLVSEAVMLGLAWRWCRWRPGPRSDWTIVRRLGVTGMHLTGHNLLLYALQQADTILMGRWFGAAALGFYNRAAQVLIQPATHLAAPFSQVLLSTLSRLGPASSEFAPQFRAATNAIAHFTLPVAVVCGVMPEEIVHLVLGANWPDAAPLLAWLSAGAAASFLTATLYALCVATGHAVRLAQLSAIALPVTVAGLWLGRHYGPTGLAAGFAIAQVGLVIPRIVWAAHGTPVALRDFAAAFAAPIGVSAVLAAGLMGARAAMPHASDGARLAVGLALGGVATVLLAAVSVRVRHEFIELWRHLPFTRPPAPDSGSHAR